MIGLDSFITDAIGDKEAYYAKYGARRITIREKDSAATVAWAYRPISATETPRLMAPGEPLILEPTNGFMVGLRVGFFNALSSSVELEVLYE